MSCPMPPNRSRSAAVYAWTNGPQKQEDLCKVPYYVGAVDVPEECLQSPKNRVRCLENAAALFEAFRNDVIINDPDINPQIRVKAVSVAIEQSGFDQRKAAEQAAGASRFIVNINLEDPTKDVTISAPIIEHEGGTGL